MKKIILGLLTFSVIIISGCKTAGGADSDPKAVLVKFFDAIASKNIDGAKKYVTKDSEGMMGLMQMGMQQMDGKLNDIFNYQKNIEYGTPAINGDKAIVPLKDKKTGEAVDFTLRKESGEWKVAFDMSTLMEMAQKKMKEHGMENMSKAMIDSITNMPNMDSTINEELQHEQKMTDSEMKK